MADSETGVEQEPAADRESGDGGRVVGEKPRGAKGAPAPSGAARMAESPIARPGAKGLEFRRSFFEVYKRNQGTYTRQGTAIGAGILVLAGVDFLYKRLPFEADATWTSWFQIGIPVLVLAVCGVLLWWVVGVNRRTCDFMIATEGEMKKVSWSGRKELFGSTKVVILFTIALSILLFVVDIAFMMFFNTIGVLKGASPMEMLLGE